MTLPSLQPLSLEVPRHLRDKRLDSALYSLLQARFPEKQLSRNLIMHLIKEGKVFLNGKSALPRTRVAQHDLITVEYDSTSTTPLPERGKKEETLPITILYEDQRLLALNKGAGVQMHAVHGTSKHSTVADWLLGKYPALSAVGEDPLRPGIVHRLDRETSGVVVVAKDNVTFQALKRIFQERTGEKTYIALVYGHLQEREGIIDAALMRKPGALKRMAVDLKKYQGALPGNTRTALTQYQVIARYQDYDLLLLTPKTGRTHQIRVHVASLGHPVVGDKLYAFKEAHRGKVLFPSRHLLHAFRLSLPLFEQKYEFQAPLPEDFRQLLQSIDETRDPSYDDEALKSLSLSSL